MVYQSRPRKRILAIRRGPDGSAFQKCESCGLTVAIALVDMHECGLKKITKKKRKTQCGSGKLEGQRIQDQPRSAFHFFMEEFIKTCKDGNEIEIDKKGCETWKNMSKEERRPFVLEADKLNSAYVKLLLKEESEMQWVDDEADSGDVGKYDETNEDSDIYCYGSESCDGFPLFLSETYDTLDTQVLVQSCPWATQKPH
ncbi:high mobility group B protein 7 [Sesamum indicum]|uniref:High mobility group B protein 7 n=1 Tax=Sesamum indicum TaxID=4182 RepID=A0A6I9TI77_SESIN|nr:high mobility group B protein 7 [Sesamum indicum]